MPHRRMALRPHCWPSVRTWDTQSSARATKSTQTGNLADAERNVRFMMTRIDREIRQLGRDAEFADPRTQLQLRAEMERLDARRDQLESWMESVTGQRAETPGNALPEPPKIPPSSSPTPKAGAPTSPTDRLRQQGLLK